MESFGTGLLALNELLNGNDARDDIDEDQIQPSSYLNPGAIAGTQPKTEVLSAKSKTSNGKDIFEEEDVEDASAAHSDAANDSRPQPEYDVKYKQAVTSEDMYLGMSNRNPSSASCEDIVIEVKLPQTAYREVVLDVNDRVLDVACPKYRLYLPLPHPVNSKQGAAQWLAKQEILRITLPLNRELEFIYRA
eukprot:TRINITY_DN2468_c0_g1_i2.p1 TRINITY_DN2468_c0_g1~~TRINITY_DN2468_c0_g1_i2.p1  ORF type:complete len:191 (+),score=25.26 TRINITY_DN2468_c0_g1_i2:87-659(+)